MLLGRNTLHANWHIFAESAVEIVGELLEEGFLEVGSEGGEGAGGGEVVEGGDEGELGEGVPWEVVLLGGVLFN